MNNDNPRVPDQHDQSVGPTTPAPGPVPARQPRRRGWWIAGGAVAGVALLGVGAVLGGLDDRDDVPVVVQAGSGLAASLDGRTGSTGSSTAGTGTAGSGAVDWTARVDLDDIELTGTELDSASAAALAAAGGEGVVISAERSDDPTHAYELEVGRADGTQMDVYLDAAFGVVATESWHRD
ncbi:MAG TPA: hypothetical protein VGC57_05145 [Cellulomonas sp.]